MFIMHNSLKFNVFTELNFIWQNSKGNSLGSPPPLLCVNPSLCVGYAIVIVVHVLLGYHEC